MNINKWGNNSKGLIQIKWNHKHWNHKIIVVGFLKIGNLQNSHARWAPLTHSCNFLQRMLCYYSWKIQLPLPSKAKWRDLSKDVV